jgi:hypothetical protein
MPAGMNYRATRKRHLLRLRLNDAQGRPVHRAEAKAARGASS